MDLPVILILTVILLLAIYLIFHPRVERYLFQGASLGPGVFSFSWSAPSNNGGDPNCCSYAYQVCLKSDTTCASPVLTGTTSTMTFSFPNAAWNTDYVASVQAVNSVGGGPLSTVSFSTGNGTLSSAVFGSQVSSSGQVVSALNTSSTQAMIYIATSNVPSGSTYSIEVTQISGDGGIVGSWNPSVTPATGGVLMTISPMQFSMGDSLNVLAVVSSGSEPIADAVFSTTISASVPGAVQGLAVSFTPVGTTCQTNTDCALPGMVCSSGSCVTQCMNWYPTPSNTYPAANPLGTVTLSGQLVAPAIAANPNAQGGWWGGFTAVSSGSLPQGTMYGPAIGDETQEIWQPETIYYLNTVPGCNTYQQMTPSSDVSDALTFMGLPVSFNFAASPAFLPSVTGAVANWGTFQYLTLA